LRKKSKGCRSSYFDTKTHGEALSLVTNDIDTISNNLAQNLSQIVTSVTNDYRYPVMMLTISWLMTLVAIVILPVSFGLITVVIKASRNILNNSRFTSVTSTAMLKKMYGGHTVIKAFNGEAKSIEEI